MSLLKSVTTSLLTISLSSASLLAHATLDITNNTSQYSTALINNNLCSSSSILGELGITKPHSTNKINDFVIWVACHSSPTSCKADVYMTKNCGSSGDLKVATIIFDTTTGIKNVFKFSDTYSFEHSAFSITMNGGPAFAERNDNGNYLMW